MRSWHEFITMGGYAIYVWPAFGLGLIVLAGNILEPILRRRRILRRLAIERELEPTAPGRGRRTSMREDQRDT